MSQNVPFQFGTMGGQPIPNQPPQQPQTSTNVPQPQAHDQPPGTVWPAQAVPRQSAQMPTLPANLADALKGIPPEQLVNIVQMVQAGLLALPPAPLAAQQSGPPAQIAVAQPGAPQAPAQGFISTERQEDVDMDKEEGELEEGEEPESGKERGFLRPPPTAPRKRSATPRDTYGRAVSDRRASLQGLGSSPTAGNARQASNQCDAPHLSRQGSPPTSLSKKAVANGQSNGRRKVDSGSAARAFVLQMHKAGYTFDQLSREVPNTKALRRMYKALSLAMPVDKPATHSNGTAAPPMHLQVDGASAPMPKQPVAIDERKSSLTKRPLPTKPAGTVDRAEYLAKLAAARTSKAQKPAPNPSPATKPGQALTAGFATSQPTQQPVPPSAPVHPSNHPTAVKATVKTELVKQRLEKLRAEQAAKASAAQQSSDPPVASSPLAKPALATFASMQQLAPAPTANTTPDASLGAGISDVGSKVPQAAQQPTTAPAPPSFQPIHAPPPPLQTTFSPTPPTPGRSFSALPGLFMASTPVYPSPRAQPSPTMPSSATVSKPTPPAFSAQQNASITTNKTFAPRPAASPAPLNIGRKRPVATDFDADIPANVAPTAPKRPLFGQSRSNSEHESLIIHVDEDEDEDDDDEEIDGASTPIQSTVTPNLGLLPGAPPRPNLASGTSTPPVVTPGDREEKHSKAIADLKRKIAIREAAQKEAKARAKTNGRQVLSTATSGNTTPVPQSAAPLAGDTTTALEASKSASLQVGANSSGSANEKPLSAAAILRQQEKARLEKRLKELHADPHFAQADGVVATPTVPTPAAAEPAISGGIPNDEPVAAEMAAVKSREALTERETGAILPGESFGQGSSEEEVEASRSADETTRLSYMSTDYRKLGSQATTASGTNHGDVEIDQAVTAPAHYKAHADDAMVEDNMKVSTVEKVAVGNAAAGDRATLHEAQEMEIDDNSSEDEDDSDGTSESNGRPPVSNESTAEELPIQHESSEDDSSSSSASSDQLEKSQAERVEQSLSMAETGDGGEDDEYEPEAVMSNPSQPQSEASNPKSFPAISDVNNIEVDITKAGGLSMDDDLAPELQPQKSQETVIEDEETTSHSTRYRPYESVLSRFKDYRYHPEYLATVSGGYKSLTYNNNIDPVKQLCMFEAAGGQCNDKTCENQHFKTMELSDTELLKALGTHRTPADTAEARQKWNAGLVAVVQQLRSSNQGKDATAIATRIAEYRREFVGDPTKTLNLA